MCRRCDLRDSTHLREKKRTEFYTECSQQNDIPYGYILTPMKYQSVLISVFRSLDLHKNELFGGHIRVEEKIIYRSFKCYGSSVNIVEITQAVF